MEGTRMQTIKNHLRLARRLFVITAMSATVLIPISAAGASADDSNSRMSNVDHGFMSGRDHNDRDDNRPPSGTVGAPVASGLNGPFGISVKDNGAVFVAES